MYITIPLIVSCDPEGNPGTIATVLSNSVLKAIGSPPVTAVKSK